MRAFPSFGWICFFAIAAAVAATAATDPTTSPSAPELTIRQQNLLMQLSDAEANIQAINKALVRTGYQVGLAYDRIDSNLKGNELMDRNGGGPVRWDAFYGNTARSFYVPRSEATLHGKRIGGELDIHVATGYHPIARPSQFDSIYKANDDQIARAKEKIASMAQDEASLLARRQKHEADQSRLWATLAWEQVRDREIDLRPLCRFALKPVGPQAAVLQPLVAFLQAADRVAAEGLESVENNQAGTFQAGALRMDAAYAALQHALADALDARELRLSERQTGQALKSLCKELAEECKVITDNYANALDRDEARQDSSKLEFRAALQTSLTEFADSVAQLDDGVVKAAKAWGIEADRSKPIVVVAASGPAATSMPLAAAPPAPAPGGTSDFSNTAANPHVSIAAPVPTAPIATVPEPESTHVQGPPSTATLTPATSESATTPPKRLLGAGMNTNLGMIRVGTLESKKAPVLSINDGVIVFKAPKHDHFWTGSNGVLLQPGSSWEQTGTVWQCGKFRPDPWGMEFIHPFHDGHVLVTIDLDYKRPLKLHVSVDGRWHPQIKELPDVRMEPDFAGFVSKKDDAMFHTLKSELSREGNYSLYVDGKLAARTRVQSAKPLELTSDFVGTNVPTVLPRGMAGAVIDNSYRARSVAGDLTLSPAR